MFGRKNKNKCSVPKECKIKIFNKTYTISIIIEGDVIDDDCMNAYEYFVEMHEQVEAKIKEYVENNYFDLIKEYYVDISFGNSTLSREYKDYSCIIKDYENKEKKAIDIVLKNIKPVYFSIGENGISLLFFLFNSVDGHGFDIVITPNFIIVPHDELE